MIIRLTMKWILIFLAFVAVTAASPFTKSKSKSKDCCEEYCYSTDPIQAQRYEFESKTAYEWAKGKNIDFTLPGCRPNKLYMFIRHGTRYPVDEEFEEIPLAKEVHADFIINYREGRAPPQGALCPTDRTLLESWKWNESITIDIADFLTPQGFEDLRGIGETFKPLIQQITPLTYDPSRFEFRHTDTQRTNESFRGFFEGLFGRGSSVNQPSPPSFNPDMLLRPYDTCEPYQLRREDKEERQLFETTDDFVNMLADVSTKLGFEKPLKKGRVNIMWDLCRYEQAWHLDKLSPWCTAFTYEQNKILHYREDIKQWYKAGYAYPENRFLMCSAVKDMVNRVRDPNGPPVTAYFAHSTGTYLMMNALGWFKDEKPLLGSNYREQADRKWFISNIAPFATNIAIVRYDCSDEIDRIKIFLKAEPMDLPWCPRGVCKVEDLVKEYEFFLNANCDQIFCQ